MGWLVGWLAGWLEADQAGTCVLTKSVIKSQVDSGWVGWLVTNVGWVTHVGWYTQVGAQVGGTMVMFDYTTHTPRTGSG